MKYNFIKKLSCGILFFFSLSTSMAQNYWQQRVAYKMDIYFDVETNQFSGSQELNYFNNSPDTLKKVFFHLYFNAFQPNSMMDVRSRTIQDPDWRVQDRISKLDNSEIGFHEIKTLKQNGKDLAFEVEGTVLEVILDEPILPGSNTMFNMTFQSQVPVQIRRSGRDNREGIEYSMAQWYPKMAEYDYRGWHAHPYVGREFYSPYGTFDVNITIDKNYIIAATGELQNAHEIGHGYANVPTSSKKGVQKLTWNFKAENVHDFVWAADPDYVHKIAKVPNGPDLHFFYQEGPETKAWDELTMLAPKAFEYMEQTFGKYPYKHYSIIQGGDGGMEYPMATLITGERDIKRLLSVTVHEGFHSWYQGVLGFNESYYEWMDEGFTSYAQDQTLAYMYDNLSNAQKGNYRSYYSLVSSGKEEPLSTHADHYTTNYAYGRAAYTKGAVALAQMNYLVGTETTVKAQKKFYNQWRFKHPTPNDWIRVFEKESGLELDWYLDYWMNTTHTIDYGIDTVFAKGTDKTIVQMKKEGKMPMPMDIYVTFTDESKSIYHTPLSIMRGVKEIADEWVVLPDWPWTHPTYEFIIDKSMDEIQSIQIDESGYLADINAENNTWEKE